MKTSTLILLTAMLAFGLLASASAQDTNAPDETTPAVPPDQMQPPAVDIQTQAPDTGLPGMAPGQAPGEGAPGAPPAEAAPAAPNRPVAPTVILPRRGRRSEGTVVSQFVPPDEPIGTNSNELRLNFHNAPLEMVLNYLSDAAGFIIVLDTRVNGTFSVISSHPVSKDEAVDLLNAVLNKNGYAVIRNERTLTVVDKNDAKTRDIPVRFGNEPSAIPKNDEIVTQIIPIRFVEARQLVADLSPFVSPQATVVANEAGNSIVITDTQANIRHVAEIIKAVDNSAEAETEIRVFHLKYASPTDVANELGSIFPNSANGNAQAPIRFGGGGPGGGGGGGRGGFFARMMAAAGGGGQNDRVKKATQVTAVADPRIQSVIVTAPRDLIEQISNMMTELDIPSERDQKVYVYHIDHGDPNNVLQVLQNSFGGGNNMSRNNSSQNDALTLRQNAGAQAAANNQSATAASAGGGGNRGGIGGGGGGGRMY